jgi:hypothetical protein
MSPRSRERDLLAAQLAAQLAAEPETKGGRDASAAPKTPALKSNMTARLSLAAARVRGVVLRRRRGAHQTHTHTHIPLSLTHTYSLARTPSLSLSLSHAPSTLSPSPPPPTSLRDDAERAPTTRGWPQHRGFAVLLRCALRCAPLRCHPGPVCHSWPRRPGAQVVQAHGCLSIRLPNEARRRLSASREPARLCHGRRACPRAPRRCIGAFRLCLSRTQGSGRWQRPCWSWAFRSARSLSYRHLAQLRCPSESVQGGCTITIRSGSVPGDPISRWEQFPFTRGRHVMSC